MEAPARRIFKGWEERVMSQEKGKRVVHYYLKDFSRKAVLAVVGTERGVRHMIYVISDDFLVAYGYLKTVDAATKWRTKRDVEEWLTKLVYEPQPSLTSKSLRSSEFSMANLRSSRSRPQGQAQDTDIVWSGDAWICPKQLKHYPAFCRKGASITVYSFAFIMDGEGNRCLGYVEDLYEDTEGEKKVKVQWFHHNQEVKNVLPQLNLDPGEVFITPRVQVINAECISGPAVVLTPKHYEKCLAFLPQSVSSEIYMCCREFKNNKVKPFSLSKMRGYSNQPIISGLDSHHVSRNKTKGHQLDQEEANEDFTLEDPAASKRTRSGRGYQKVGVGHSGVTNSISGGQQANCGPTRLRLKLKLSNKGPVGIKLVGPEAQGQHSRVGESIEFLCQDSGLRGCWFRCKILQEKQKLLKVLHYDVDDADGPGKLEEWIPSSRVAAPDKLGLRCTGRLTVRPFPPKESFDISFQVGAPVDAWWCDGWWEGVLTGFDISRCDEVKVYLPGENRFVTLERRNIRSSRDWINNEWVEIKAKPEVLSFISKTVSPTMTPPICPTSAAASESSVLRHHEMLNSAKLKLPGDNGGKSPVPATSAHDQVVEDLKKQLCIIDGKDRADEGVANNQDAGAGIKVKSALKNKFDKRLKTAK